jgi:nucleoside 2-deoxyribosyltransferase
MKVYLGGSKGEWRKHLMQEYNMEFYDPFSDSQRSILEFTQKDLEEIRNSDVIFVVINYPVYTSACAEIGYAFAFKKPVILVFLLKDFIDPMIMVMSRKVFTDYEKAVDWLSKYIEETERNNK